MFEVWAASLVRAFSFFVTFPGFLSIARTRVSAGRASPVHVCYPQSEVCIGFIVCHDGAQHLSLGCADSDRGTAGNFGCSAGCEGRSPSHISPAFH